MFGHSERPKGVEESLQQSYVVERDLPQGHYLLRSGAPTTLRMTVV